MAPLVLAEQQRRVLAGVWAYRARSERQAEVRFGRLARELEAHAAGPALVALAERAARDEARHTEICAALAADYGDAGDSAATPEAAPIGAPGLGPRQRLLYELTAFGCITESLNAALMAVTYEEARVPEVRAAVREILADEVRHSRLGWAHLAVERARGGGDFLAAQLPRMLAGAVAEELFSPAVGPADPLLLAHGELPEAVRLELLLAALRDVVFPGLERQHIDCAAGRDWLAKLRARPAAGAAQVG